MTPYDHKKIDKKWQKIWDKEKIYQAKDPSTKLGASMPKWYSLIEFPYPSGEGLHIGHPRSYIGMDVISRKRRAEGYNVLYPIGWDAFGLPTENYAIKTGQHPAVITKKNTDTFRRQIKMLGASFDWSREINTTDPAYYKWTQWIFLQMYKKGLAYKKKMEVNWCPKDKIVLANEEVVDGKCERCGTPAERREKEQWMLAITKYADRLDKDLDTVDYLERIKIQQRNWIGRSEGAEFQFDDLKIFTTRPDTIFGVTFVAIPGKADKFTGRHVKNPVTGEKVPVWEAEYVLADYGTGAIMGVPAHDERDFEFATRHKLPIKDVVTSKAVTQKFGTLKTTYKLRDWIFSRQRYWGEPIPMIHCPACALRDPSGQGWIAVPEKDLPVKLPKVKNYVPTDTGESPLAAMTKWVNTKCPVCKGPAKRETDTMPNWAGSSWYFLRYADPRNKKVLADPKKLKYWTPVDWYNGGMEHTTLHLLYSRFWHKFLFDIGVVPTSEPYLKRTSHGFILAEGGEKMSKSKGNIVNPDSIIEKYGADTLRLYEMFMGPFEQSVSWSTDGIVGPRRFLEKVWRLREKVGGSGRDLESSVYKTIKKVSDDIEAMRFNTAVSVLMILSNDFEKAKEIPQSFYEIFLQLIAPFAPHMAEELWASLGHKKSINLERWPQFDSSKIIQDSLTIIVQVNGKLRAEFSTSANSTETEITRQAQDLADIKKHTAGKKISKIIYVKNKLVNFVLI